MQASPSVSIIVPAYNMESYIAEALRSIQAQTFADYECVIVDDGSEDATPARVESFLDDKRFRLMKQPHSGVSAARNTALRVCSGDFIAFMDADDMWLPEMLAARLALFEKSPDANLAITNFAWMRNGVPGPPRYDLFRRQCAGDPLAQLCSRMPFWICTMMFRRYVLEDIHGFDESLSCAEDYDLTLRAAQQVGLTVRGDNRVLAYRRFRPGSLARNRDNLFEMNIRVLEDAIDREKNPQYSRLLFRHCEKLTRNHAFESLAREARDLLPNRKRDAAAQLTRAWRVKPKRLRYLFWALRLTALGSIEDSKFVKRIQDRLVF